MLMESAAGPHGSSEPVRTAEVGVIEGLPNTHMNSVTWRERHPVAAESDRPVLFSAC